MNQRWYKFENEKGESIWALASTALAALVKLTRYIGGTFRLTGNGDDHGN